MTAGQEHRPASAGTTKRPFLRCLLLAAALLVPSATARAAPPEANLASMVVVNAPATDALLVQAAARASAELQVAGFQVQRSDCRSVQNVTCGRPWPAGVETVAAIVLQRSGETVSIDLRLARAGQPDATVLRRDVEPRDGAAPQPGVIAVCTSELVRAGLVASPAPAAEARPTSLKGFGEIGPAGLVSVGLGYGLRLRIGIVRRETWALSIAVVATRAHLRDWASAMSSASSAGGGSRSTIESGPVAYDAAAHLQIGRRWRQHARLQPELSAGAGVHHLSVDAGGQVMSPWTPFLAAGAGLGWKLGDTWTVRTDLQILVLRDRLNVTHTSSNEGGAGVPEPHTTVWGSWPVLPVLTLGVEGGF